MLSERRSFRDEVETIAAFAKDMNWFLQESELTETRSFIRSFVKEIVVSLERRPYAIASPCRMIAA